MNGSSFPATMEREGGSGCGNKVTLASSRRRCMAEPSRTQILYAQGVWMCGCSGQGMGGSRKDSERFFLRLPAYLKDAERVPGAAVLAITLPPPLPEDTELLSLGNAAWAMGDTPVSRLQELPASPSQPCTCPGAPLGFSGTPAALHPSVHPCRIRGGR